MTSAHGARRGRRRGPAAPSLSLDLAPLLSMLLSERSVTKAAELAGMSQSAMSHVLAKLRGEMNDPLLVRTSRGIELTPRAESLAEPLSRTLAELERLFTSLDVEPKRLERRFVLAMPDYLAWLLLPDLVATVAREAPGVDLEVRSLDPRALTQQLEVGEVDVAIGGGHDASLDLVRRSLFRESFMCVVRRNHPATRGRFTLARYAELGHVLVALRTDAAGVVDNALAGVGARRRVVVRVPYFLLAPRVVATSDLVLTVPTQIAEQMSKMYPLAIVKPPLELPSTEILMTWHARFTADPAHRWFRETVAKTAEATKRP